MFESKLAALRGLIAQLRLLPLNTKRAREDYPFAADDIRKFQQLTTDGTATSIDDMTWKDMLVEDYSKFVSAGCSIFGRQVLHKRLRDGLSNEESNALGERLTLLMGDPIQLEKLRNDCGSLRNAESEIASLLLEDDCPKVPRWKNYTWLLPLTLAGSVAAAMWSNLAWLITALVMYVLMSTQVRYGTRMAIWATKIHSLQMLLRTGSLLGNSKNPLLAHIAARSEQMGKLNRTLTRSPILGMMPGGHEYSDWFMLGNVKYYYDGIVTVFKYRDFFLQCYIDIANFEADVTLAMHLMQTPVWCRTVRREGTGLLLVQGIHPLLNDPIPLSMEVQASGVFISGQNGIGKSTLLRTVGLNLITSRAFGFSYAQEASLSALPIYSSMQGEDSLFCGESLYVSELRRAKELIAIAAGPQPAIFIIDEIFRGTNHLESVAASAAVLNRLAEKGIVLVASHNLIIASLLAHRLTPLCVTAPSNGNHRLTLTPGILKVTNGISLLDARGFDPTISADAGRVFEWLNSYLAHPTDCCELLNAV